MIPFTDLRAQYKTIKKEIDSAIADVLNRSDFILGKDLEIFEKNLAKYCESKFAVGMNSGTDALFFSLRAIGIKPGDEVITSTFSFIAAAEVILLLGAKPVFVDIEPDTYNINARLIERAITKKTKAIIPVHLYGQPAEMDLIMKIARKHKLFVIEDAAQAIGATYKGKKICSIGDIGCLSFFPAKNLGCYGDGGAIVTNNKQIAKKIKMLINHGSQVRYRHELLGDSSRLDNLQASILNIKLKYIDKWNNKRISIAKEYTSLLKKSIVAPTNKHYAKTVYQQYTIRVKQREKLKSFLFKNGIPTSVHYPTPIHLQPVFKKMKIYKKGDFPIAEKASNEVLSLPIYPELPKHIISKIARLIIQFNEK